MNSMTQSLAEASDTLPLQTSVMRPLIVGFLLFALLFLGGGVWLVGANLAGAVIASGVVSVEGEPKSIQHLDGGVVTDILVSDGDHVDEGDVLLRLDDTMLVSNIEIYGNRLREASARMARLNAERDGHSLIKWDNELLARLNVPVDPEIRAGQQKLFEARQRTKNGQLEQLDEQIAQLNNQIEGLRNVVLSERKQLRLLGIEYESLKELTDQGYAASNRVLSMQREMEQLNGQIAERETERASVENSISETQIQMLQVEREFNQSVLTELREVESSVNDLVQQLQATREQLSRVEMRAPVAGMVHELGVHTIGGVIGPGGVVMEIVPQTNRMEFEVSVEPQYIDQIYIGQPANVMFSAFSARTTPQLNGEVSGVSPDSIVVEETGASFYQIRVAIADEELARLDGRRLVPGMPVEVFLQTEERSPLDYLTKPLTDNIQRAMREE